MCVCVRVYEMRLPLGGQSCSACGVLVLTGAPDKGHAIASTPTPGDGCQIYRPLSNHRCNSLNANPEELISVGAQRSRGRMVLEEGVRD